MNIEIELKDPKFCSGCPCRQASYFGGSPDCGQGYDIEENMKSPHDMDESDIRPQECIEKHGE